MSERYRFKRTKGPTRNRKTPETTTGYIRPNNVLLHKEGWYTCCMRWDTIIHTIAGARVVRDDAGGARHPGVSGRGRDSRVALEAGRVFLASVPHRLAVFRGGRRTRRRGLGGDLVRNEEGARGGDGKEQRCSGRPAASTAARTP